LKVEHLHQFNQELNVSEKRGGHLTQLGDRMITIYTNDGCVFCEKAIQLCKTEKYIYRSLPISNDVLEKIEYLMGFKPRTVPQIFVNEQYLGGFTDLKVWHNDREQRQQADAMVDEGGPTYSESMQNDLEPIS
jgi:glutaredoxin